MSAAFQISNDVPIPANRAHGNAKYPWRDMQVGSSFFIPGRTAGALAGAKSTAKKNTGFRFTTRTVTENGVNGCRVWRVA